MRLPGTRGSAEVPGLLLLGTDPYDLFHPEDLERIRFEAHEKALDGRRPFR